MNMSKDEPAYPSSNEVNIGNVGTGGHSGMSLRDYFAAKALQARLTLKDGRTRDEIVEDAYGDADAMLAERAKPRS
jgi:hypothetical protein